MTATDDIAALRDILSAWGLESMTRASRVSIGLINQTYLVEGAGERFILQQLHPIFDASIHYDIEVITRHLQAKGVLTPRLVPTTDGRLWVQAGQAIWRLQTYIEGCVRSEMESPAMARAAGLSAACFHRALADMRHEFHFTRGGVHDTPGHVARLEQARAKYAGQAEVAAVSPVADAILGHARHLPPIGQLPVRLVHGDLKLSNLLFDPSLQRVLALIDLDTLAYGTLATEMGDALRSWCNPSGESAAEAEVDVGLFAAAVEGYAEGSLDWITAAEIDALRPGAETIALELASRFCTDAFEDRYFGWDATRFASRREHNLVRARSQLSLARSIHVRAGELDGAVRRAFGG